MMKEIQTSFDGTSTASSNLPRLKRELEKILDECSLPDWNGYAAKPVDPLSAAHVYRFLKKLPKEISCPKLAPEPNGDIGMIWHQHGYHLVIGIDRDGCLAWGGTSPGGHIYGDDRFISGIPEILVDLLHAIEGTGQL